MGNKSLHLSVSLVLCFEYALSTAVAAVIIAACKPKASTKTTAQMLGESLTPNDLLVAVLMYCSRTFSSKAMSLTSPPFVILGSSAKIIPVIILGKLRGVYNPRPMQYAVAITIFAGLVVFNAHKFFEEDTKKGKDGESQESPLGVVLVFASLVFDGLTQT